MDLKPTGVDEGTFGGTSGGPSRSEYRPTRIIALIVGRVRETEGNDSEGRVGRGSWWGMKRMEGRLPFGIAPEFGAGTVGGGGREVGTGGALADCSLRLRVIADALGSLLLVFGRREGLFVEDVVDINATGVAETLPVGGPGKIAFSSTVVTRDTGPR